MRGAAPGRPAVRALSWRLLRRGSLILIAAVAVYLAIEVISYVSAYPNAADRARLAKFGDNPAVRMLQGIPRNVDTIGGFVSWDGGWFLEWLVAIWSLFAVTRLLRADEESDRAGLVHTVALPPRGVLLAQMQVIWGVVSALGATAGLVLAVLGAAPGGAALFGASLAAFGCAAAAVGAVASQLLPVRRHAIGLGAAVLACGFFIRMVANSSPSRGWLRWFTPFGWMDELHPYGGPRVVSIALLAGSAVGGLVLAAVLRERRDTGGAILTERRRHGERTRLLGSPVGIGWRITRGALAAWALGLGVYAMLIGAMLKTLVDYVHDDPTYLKTLEAFGIDGTDISRGMVGFMTVMFGLAFALYGCWRLGAVRVEEESGRADLLLVRPVTRLRWLGGHLLLALASILTLTVSTGLGLWVGAVLTGGDLGLLDSMRASFNPLPVVLALTAVAVLLFGLRPRLTVPVAASVAAVAYLLPSIGQALDWPSWVLDVSPFQHLAVVPAQPYALQPGLIMLAVAGAIGLVGVLGFLRRDTVGA